MMDSFGELASVPQDVRSQGMQSKLNLGISGDAESVERRLGRVEVAAEQRSYDVQDRIHALTRPYRKRGLIVNHAVERLDVDAGPVSGIENRVHQSLICAGSGKPIGD